MVKGKLMACLGIQEKRGKDRSGGEYYATSVRQEAVRSVVVWCGVVVIH